VVKTLGENLDCWWIDGCFDWPIMRKNIFDWPTWYHAMRASNPDACVAFNDGTFCVNTLVPAHTGCDYIAGETEVLTSEGIRLGRDDNPTFLVPESQFAPGTSCQNHALIPIDAFWSHGVLTEQVSIEQTWMKHIKPLFAVVPEGNFPMESPVYSDAILGGFLARARAARWGVTLNVGIYQEGHLGAETIAQLQRLKIAGKV
jgi:hypothetical protein